MSILVTGAEDFLASALTAHTPLTPDPEAFLRERAAASSFRVEQVPLGALANWHLGGDRLSHSSGRFFAVEGLSVRTNFGPVPRWCQPVIVQPDIGVLGILTQRIDGVHHFLMQAKMEPGNSALVQYSATVQATPSNYQRVHGGKPTPYLDYFLRPGRRAVVFDQLLSEHSSWYLYKRNRNMIVEVPPDERVPVGEEFTWLTLGQLRGLLARGNRVNMNARTVLSSIAYATARSRPGGGGGCEGFHAEVVRSHRRQTSDGEVARAMTWLIDQKTRFELDVRRIALRDMAGWTCDERSIRHRERRYFEIVGLSVGATSREVAAWTQPMLRPNPGNVVAFVCRGRRGALEFLVQAMAQPGATDRVELAATVQLTPGNYEGPGDLPPLAALLDCDPSWRVVDAVQSEDGGRFLHADTRHVVIRLPDGHAVEAPAHYRWMSLGLLNRLMRLGYYVNVETRSLMACLL
ncbi:NDP-hexose 2,3-dehydratase family protein [Kitasatospora sp. NPDC056651]|uniref:NDP-hexose 2,3-dehydratase family protein n=1 Tax=Kitasatospora sp. NPDC056651 TaxID=3345892 RepID=UPI0036B3E410